MAMLDDDNNYIRLMFCNHLTGKDHLPLYCVHSKRTEVSVELFSVELYKGSKAG